MSKTTTFEAWAVSTPDGESGFVHLAGAHHIPWLTQSSEECAGEAIRQRQIGLPLAHMSRVRVTVEVIEEAAAMEGGEK